MQYPFQKRPTSPYDVGAMGYTQGVDQHQGVSGLDEIATQLGLSPQLFKLLLFGGLVWWLMCRR